MERQEVESSVIGAVGHSRVLEIRFESGRVYQYSGEMKRLDIEGKAVVLARVGDEYYAIGGNCTHYAAPLDEGVLKGHMLICPWPHPFFDVRSGQRLEPPALNDARHYAVRIE